VYIVQNNQESMYYDRFVFFVEIRLFDRKKSTLIYDTLQWFYTIIKWKWSLKNFYLVVNFIHRF